MERLFKKDEIWFAVVWIIIYVVGFSTADSLSESIGAPKLFTVFLGLIISAFAYAFIKKNNLFEYFGLCNVKGSGRSYLYFIPLIVITSVNLWNGVTLNSTVFETALYIISMCFVGFMEEVIFRGFLFKGMCKNGIKSAIIVSSLTFGMGHIVNLIMGAPIFDTMLQLIYASAIGFCYTAIFYATGSIIPCIISHALVNSLSIFAAELTNEANVIVAIIQTVISTGYGMWLLHNKCKINRI